MQLTVGTILEPKRAYSLIDCGRLLTMRTTSSPPLVGPRLGLTRSNTGRSCSLTGTGGTDPSSGRGVDVGISGKLFEDVVKGCAGIATS